MRIVKNHKVYNPSEVIDVINEEILFSNQNLLVYDSKSRTEYINLPVAFDIETTSFRNEKNEKVAIMYSWMLTIGTNQKTILGRTWEEFKMVMEYIKSACALYYDSTAKTNKGRLMLIYIHNAAFEHAFLTKFNIEDTFSTGSHKPIKFRLFEGFEFRCSYMLSALSLQKTAENLTKYKIEKKVGDLDYKLLRHSKTELTDEEIDYMCSDTEIVCFYIDECIINDGYGYIYNIPLTNTGRVRTYLRDKCLYASGPHNKKNPQYKKYRSLMNKLTLDENTYKLARDVYCGGFTHANAFSSGKTFENVTSYDFTSSYPSTICELFPMDSGEWYNPKSEEDFYNQLEDFCCCFYIRFNNIRPKLWYDNPISSSKCLELSEDAVINNGRVVSASSLLIGINEVYFEVINDFYEWDDFELGDFLRFKKEYLPKEIIEAVLGELYYNKCTLKGIKEKIAEFFKSKGMLNSFYGCMVQDPCKEQFEFNGKWCKIDSIDIKEKLEDYNKNTNRFGFYYWGIYISAYAYRNLFNGIQNIKDDYIYADTDSMKIINEDKHRDYFKEYNEIVEEKFKDLCDFYNLSYDIYKPLGKIIGIWDREGDFKDRPTYKKFKTLGAKRYIVIENCKSKETGELKEEFEITISGLNKKVSKYLINKYNDRVFDEFKDELEIPSSESLKNTHTFIEERRVGTLTDYRGISCNYDSYGGVHLEEQPFKMTLSPDYENYLKTLDYIFEDEESDKY